MANEYKLVKCEIVLTLPPKQQKKPDLFLSPLETMMLVTANTIHSSSPLARSFGRQDIFDPHLFGVIFQFDPSTILRYYDLTKQTLTNPMAIGLPYPSSECADWLDSMKRRFAFHLTQLVKKWQQEVRFLVEAIKDQSVFDPLLIGHKLTITPLLKHLRESLKESCIAYDKLCYDMCVDAPSFDALTTFADSNACTRFYYIMKDDLAYQEDITKLKQVFHRRCISLLLSFLHLD
jgi:hypothetical protein